MRVAALYDIHGNLPALEAVLEEVRAARVDRIVIGGDIFPGPMAHDTLARLTAAEVPVDFIYGNCDVAVMEHIAGKVPSLLPESYRPIIAWNADRLDAAQRRLLDRWPATLRLTIPPLGDVLFCHATPENENDIFTRSTAEERLRSIFDATDAAVVVCGHTHMQFDRMVGKTRVVNAGSVGMPFGRPGADWLQLGADVELRHTSYDLAAAADRVRRSGYPGADEFAAKYILNPPSEVEMMKVFAGAELK
jgi:putative phosphoesterase